MKSKRTIRKIGKQEKKILKKPNFIHLDNLITKDAVRSIRVQDLAPKCKGLVVVHVDSLMLLIAAARQLVGMK